MRKSATTTKKSSSVQTVVIDEKQLALTALEARKNEAKKKGQIDNSSLHAGSPMYYYCRSCGLQSDILPESWDPRFTRPKRICGECKELEDKGWLA